MAIPGTTKIPEGRSIKMLFRIAQHNENIGIDRVLMKIFEIQKKNEHAIWSRLQHFIDKAFNSLINNRTFKHSALFHLYMCKISS